MLLSIETEQQMTPTSLAVLICIIAIILILKFIKHIVKWILVGIISIAIVITLVFGYHVDQNTDNMQPTYYNTDVYHAQS